MDVALAFSAAGWVDAIVAVALALAALAGAIRGLGGELGRIAACIVGITVGYFAHAPIRQNVFTGSAETYAVLAVAATAVAAVLAGLLAKWLVSRFLRILIGQPADSILGAVLCCFSSAVVLLAVFAVVRMIPIGSVQETVFEKSMSGRFASPIVESFINRAK